LRHRRFEADPAEQKGSQPMSGAELDKSNDSGWEPADNGVGRDGAGPGSRTLDLEDDQTEAADMPPIKIGLWGPPSSGKTTYLAALRQAVLSADRSIGQWNIIPVGESSKKLLIDWSHRLVTDRMFPEPTDWDAAVSLKWLFLGDLAGSRYDHRRFGRRRRLECRFLLDLVDVSGEAFGDHPDKDQVKAVPQWIKDRALDHLEDADGLIYLFDPITERDKQSASVYLNSTLTDLSQRMLGHIVGHQLPKEISVCVTKFDHPELFGLARRVGLVNYGLDGMPRVLDKDAERFFDLLCTEGVWGDGEHDEEGNASAKFVRLSLQKSFNPKKIEYYVTSSIGYRKPPGWNSGEAALPGYEFNPKGFNNIDMTKDGEKTIPKIRGPIRPINVLEPLISLHQRAAGRA
jgi:hypothetical protein